MKIPEILFHCWKGRDLWFPEIHTVIFEGNDEGLLDYASLYPDDPAFEEAAEFGDVDFLFYGVYSENKTLYRFAWSIDETFDALADYENLKCYDITTCGKAVEAIEDWRKACIPGNSETSNFASESYQRDSE